jgi:hypothetical protein
MADITTNLRIPLLWKRSHGTVFSFQSQLHDPNNISKFEPKADDILLTPETLSQMMCLRDAVMKLDNLGSVLNVRTYAMTANTHKSRPDC